MNAADSWLYGRRIAIGREEMLAPLRDNPAQLGGVAALQVKGNFMFDPATHRDFLGAILNTGQQQLWQRTGDPSAQAIIPDAAVSALAPTQPAAKRGST